MTKRVVLKRSLIGQPPKTRRVVVALGLGKVGSSVPYLEHPTFIGMLNKVGHLVKVERS